MWVGDEKIAAIGVRVARGRTRHGFALNVDPDLTMFEHIVPCGIPDRGVTSMARLLGRAPAVREVTDRVVARFAEAFGFDAIERQDVAWKSPPVVAPTADGGAPVVSPVRLLGRLAAAGVEADPEVGAHRPEWMRVRAHFDDGYLELKKTMRGLDLHTVCEEAGCPNIYECWSDRTATFMILGDRCTRACGFCQVDTRKPESVDTDEPRRVAEAVATMGLAHAVITCVARDDLADGGASVFADTVHAVRATNPGHQRRVADLGLQGRCGVARHDLRGSPGRAEPQPRDGRAIATRGAPIGRVRAFARRARPCSCGRAHHEVGHHSRDGRDASKKCAAAITDLRAVGVDILTVGQYLRPSAEHLPVVRWWTPDEFAEVRDFAESLGFRHVEAGPLVRSSYHARAAVDAKSAVLS